MVLDAALGEREVGVLERLLDLGSGWGPIALTMALMSPAATVHAVDVNERCIALTAENAKLLGLGNVRSSAPDDVDPDLELR